MEDSQLKEAIVVNASTRKDLTDPNAHLIYEALEQLGRSTDPQNLIDRIRRLEIGLPAEDEFSMLLGWLGKCKLVHKLDQLQTPPESKSDYQVPDLLAIFEHNNKPIPVLIEVKSAKSNVLSWKPNYFEGLKRYGQEIGLPVLVAWKGETSVTEFGFWSLFNLENIKLAQKNYNINRETAMKENLLGLLAGDFAVELKDGVGLYLIIRKVEKLNESKEDGQVNETWRIRIEDAYYTNGDGERVNNLDPGLWALFISAFPQERQEEVDDTLHRLSFLVSSGVNTGVFAHRALPILLMFMSKEEDRLRWRDILQNYRSPIDCQQLRTGAKNGITQKIVRYVFNFVPQTKPDFLRD